MIEFFLKRPIFAFVLSILIVLFGAISLRRLPVEQYPQITPPVVSIATTFPGATAQTMSDSVAAPLEQALNGTENLIYMISQNVSPGYLNLNLYFEIGSDPNAALNSVQNRVSLALSSLPKEVQTQGVDVKTKVPSVLQVIAIEAKNGAYDDIFVANYAKVNIAEGLQRVKGVAQADVINARDYSMRIWLKPDLMGQYGLTTSDVVQAVKSQSAVRSLGSLGRQPTATPIDLTIPIDTQGRLKDPQEFEEIILKATANGSVVRVKDVGRVDLGAATYEMDVALNGEKGSFIVIYQESGANAINVGEGVRKKLEELSPRFPIDITYSIPYDTTIYIKDSIQEVEWTIGIAALLVSGVIFLFLQSLRLTLVPVIAMIISIMGTFLGMHFLGFSINTLTLFGLVLAVGIVVDDAIVVVENIERNMHEFDLPVKEAALKTMREVAGPIIAIVLVLCAVFLPVAFIGGIPGQFYKQFALTITVSVFISGLVALCLSPVLSTLLLKKRRSDSLFTTKFHHYFEAANASYLKGTRWLLERSFFAFSSFIACLALIAVIGMAVPLGFIPHEDQGTILASAELPDGASLNRTEKVAEKVAQIFKQSPAVQDVIAVSGYDLLQSISRNRAGCFYVSLKDWSQRRAKKLHAAEVIDTLNREFAHIPEAKVTAFSPPDIPGMGIVNGLAFWLVSTGDTSINALSDVAGKILRDAKKMPEFDSFITSIEANCMQLHVDVDLVKAESYGVAVDDVYSTLQTLLGSVNVGNFNKFGHIFQVIAQAEPIYREQIGDIGNIFVRSKDEKMVPINSLITTKFNSAPTLINRFDGAPAVLISIIPNAGPDQVMSAMEKLAAEYMLPGMKVAWSGIAYEMKESGGPSLFVLLGGLVMVFFVLAALYENWSMPIIILLAIPFGILGALIAIWVTGLSNDIFFQIGIVTLIGLASKNAILIVEFARLKRKEGLSATDAALESARLRFRAIVMTSLTFIFGALPLVLSSGAGAASRHSVGTGLIGGMFFATCLALFFVPFFFKKIEERRG